MQVDPAVAPEVERLLIDKIGYKVRGATSNWEGAAEPAAGLGHGSIRPLPSRLPTLALPLHSSPPLRPSPRSRLSWLPRCAACVS